MEIRFRYARIQDLPAIIDIYNSTIPSRMVTADTEPVTVESRIEWFNKHGKERPLLIAEGDEGMVGWIAFHAFYGRPAYMATAEVSVYLDEQFRGRGLGSKVLTHGESVAREIGVKTLLGYIFAHNEPSLRLFRKHGFDTWGNLPNVAVLDGIERSLHILGKRIA